MEHSLDGKLLHSRSIVLRGSFPNILHDMAVTENYHVLYINPITLHWPALPGIVTG